MSTEDATLVRVMRRGIVAAAAVIIVLTMGLGVLPPSIQDAHAQNLVVNTTDDHDVDTGGCEDLPGDCTLREAIMSLAASGDTISFGIPGAGPHTIKPTTSLPPITFAGVTVDGYTQDGAVPNTAAAWQAGNAQIRIIIDGSENTEPNGPGLYLFAPNLTVRGLSIVNAEGEGIKTGTLIGGIKVAGNYIGVLPDGVTAGPNGVGIELRSSATGNIIGGPNPADRNVISGNTGDGLLASGGQSIVVSGNFVGTSASGTTAVPNGAFGLHMDGAPHSTVGGNTNGAGNLVSGNALSGIALTTTDSQSTNVKGNRIGTAGDGTTPLPNQKHGVYLATGAHDNTIGGEFNVNEQNIIAYNLMAGVALAASAGANNYIDPNVTHSNVGLGTDLLENGVTLNDADDSDAGPNNLMNFPVLNTATYDGATLSITGTITTEPGAINMFVFANSSCDPSGYGEGGRFLGSIGLIINSTAPTGFSRTNTPNPPLTDPTWLTMSASDPESSSEFSLCKLVAFTNGTPTPTATPPTATPTEVPTPTPTTTPVVTPTESPQPTFTDTPAPRHGDLTCTGVVDEQDMMVILMYLATDQTGTSQNLCPVIGETYNGHLVGDLDCDGLITALDALIALLREVPDALLPLPSGCPSPGDLL